MTCLKNLALYTLLVLICCVEPAAAEVRNNLFLNPSFENAEETGVATSWHTASHLAGTPTYELSTIGVVDGQYSQKIRYQGLPTDSGKVTELYQYINGSDIYIEPGCYGLSVAEGDVITASVYLSGNNNGKLLMGVESFDENHRNSRNGDFGFSKNLRPRL